MCTRKFKLYFFRKFQLYQTVLSSIVTILCIRSLLFIHLINGSLYLCTSLSLFPLAPTLFSHSVSLFFLIPHITDIMSYLSFSAWLISLSIISLRNTHVVTNGRIPSFFMVNNIPWCVYLSHIVFIHSLAVGHLA